MVLKFLGTREQKENNDGNTGTKAMFREQENRKKNLLGNKGTQGKFCWEQRNMDSPPPPS